MVDDLTWLRGQVYAWLEVPADPAAFKGLVVEPTDLGAARGAREIIALAGYPTGKHHTLIKAAEARLAIQMGASEVWVSTAAQDPNTLLADLVAIRDACPAPARLGALLDDATLANTARRAGFDRVIGADCCVAASLEEAIAALDRGKDVAIRPSLLR